jgi:hypothetical protein
MAEIGGGGMMMSKTISGLLAVVLLSGCAVQRAETARNAKVQMVGLPKEKVLACMGVPAKTMTVGQTEVWAYLSGNGHSEGSAVVSGDNGIASGFAVSSRRFCNVSIVMTNGAVSEVNYSGPTGGLLTAGEQCAFAVQNCAQPPS